jgi:hypothetical protein
MKKIYPYTYVSKDIYIRRVEDTKGQNHPNLYAKLCTLACMLSEEADWFSSRVTTGCD